MLNIITFRLCLLLCSFYGGGGVVRGVLQNNLLLTPFFGESDIHSYLTLVLLSLFEKVLNQMSYHKNIDKSKKS